MTCILTQWEALVLGCIVKGPGAWRNGLRNGWKSKNRKAPLSEVFQSIVACFLEVQSTEPQGAGEKVGCYL